MKMFAALVLSILSVAAVAPAQTLNDAQIAAIVVTANQVDIDAGKLAADRATSNEVKQFGELMMSDHSGVNAAAVELVTRLGVAPQENPTSESLKAGGEENLARLETLHGSAFDQAYIDHEVAYHQQVLDALDQALIPNAQNDELKALLVKVRPAFVAHLERAKEIRSALPR